MYEWLPVLLYLHVLVSLLPLVLRAENSFPLSFLFHISLTEACYYLFFTLWEVQLGLVFWLFISVILQSSSYLLLQLVFSVSFLGVWIIISVIIIFVLIVCICVVIFLLFLMWLLCKNRGDEGEKMLVSVLTKCHRSKIELAHCELISRCEWIY